MIWDPVKQFACLCKDGFGGELCEKGILGRKCTSYFICLKFLAVYHLHILLNYLQILWTKERVVHYDLGKI